MKHLMQDSIFDYLFEECFLHNLSDLFLCLTGNSLLDLNQQSLILLITPETIFCILF